MSPLVDAVAGTRGFAVAPIERFTVSSNGLMQLSGESRLHEKIRLDEKGITALGRRLRESPEPIPEPGTDARLQVLYLYRLPSSASVSPLVAMVVRSGGQSVVQARQCLGSWHRLFIAEARREWKDRLRLASPVKGTV